LDDNLLYAELKAGKAAALEAFVERYHGPVAAFLYRLTDDRALADDLAQEVFIRLLQYQGQAPFYIRSWMFTMARNLAYDHFRSPRYRHEQRSDGDNGHHASGQDSGLLPERLAIAGDARREVAAALQGLPPEQREVVILRFYHDLALGEIAEITNAPLGTVKSRLFHALKKLKEQLLRVGEAYE
jgi:RNA polymerase sigma-70 factor, ECF subfamily